MPISLLGRGVDDCLERQPLTVNITHSLHCLAKSTECAPSDDGRRSAAVARRRATISEERASNRSTDRPTDERGTRRTTATKTRLWARPTRTFLKLEPAARLPVRASGMSAAMTRSNAMTVSPCGRKMRADSDLIVASAAPPAEVQALLRAPATWRRQQHQQQFDRSAAPSC